MAEIHEQMVQKTRREIQHAFIELVQEEGFHAVSVKKIAKLAGINRGTFYLHFVDKYEVMEHVQEELLEVFKKALNTVYPKDAFLTIQQNQLYPPFVAIFHLISENAVALRALLGVNGDPSFVNKVKNLFGETIVRRLVSLTPHVKDDTFRQYMLAFMTSAILGVIQQWLENYEEQTAEEMANIHYKLLKLISNISNVVIEEK